LGWSSWTGGACRRCDWAGGACRGSGRRRRGGAGGGVAGGRAAGVTARSICTSVPVCTVAPLATCEEEVFGIDHGAGGTGVAPPVDGGRVVGCFVLMFIALRLSLVCSEVASCVSYS